MPDDIEDPQELHIADGDEIPPSEEPVSQDPNLCEIEEPEDDED